MDSRPSKKPTSRATVRRDPDDPAVPSPAIDKPNDAFLSSPQKPGELGWLGQYRVLAELGRGGMGVVFRAEDTRLKRQVAIKVLLPDLSANPRAKARFLREVQAQAKVEDDNIIPIFGVDEANGVAFIVMPLLKGQTLAAALKLNPRPPVAELVRIGREMALGLGAAHAAGLIHRDIKPTNVWLEGTKRRVKILDFGLARSTETPPSKTAATATGAVMGTPAFLSPEQARSQAVDSRSDLFSLGVVLYQMATGQLPFTGQSVYDVMAAVVSHEPAAVQTLAPDLPEDLSKLIQRLMAKDPKNRPASAAVVAAELEAIEGGLVAYPTRVVSHPAIPTNPSVSDPWLDLDTTEPGDDDSESDEPQTLSSAIDDSRNDSRAEVRRPRKSRQPPHVMWLCVAAGVLAVLVVALFVVKGFKPAKLKEEQIVEKDKRQQENNKDNIKDGNKQDSKQGTKLPPPPVSEEYKAAKLLNRHVDLALRFNSGNGLMVAKGQTLPTDAFVVTRIEFPPEELPPNFVENDFLPVIKELRSVGYIKTRLWVLPLTESQLLRMAEMPLAQTLSQLEAGVELTPRVFDTLKDKFPNLTFLACRVEAADDDLLERLKELPKLNDGIGLEYLGKSGKVTDRGLTAVAKLNVEYVSLTGAPAAPAFIRLMPAHSKATVVNFWGSPVTDDDLEALAKCSHIKHIDLGGTKVTDAGLKHFETMPNLEYLSLTKTDVTESGARELAGKLLRCKIVWNDRDIAPPDKPPVVAGETVGLAFDGKSTFVSVPKLAFDGKLPITIEAWITPLTVDGTERHICLLGEPGGGLGFGKGGELGIGFNDGKNWHNDYSRVTLQPGKKVHVAGVVTKDRILLFLNGKEIGTKPVNLGVLPATIPPTLIGKPTKNGGGTFYHGTIHGLRISNSARYTAKEYVVPAKLEADDDTVALYRFNEGKGTTLNDHSKNKYHGEITNGAWVEPKKP